MKYLFLLLSGIVTVAHANPILNLWRVGSIKFGRFKLKDGDISPIYFNLRPIISIPELFKEISLMVSRKATELSYDTICGVPYAALPIATVVAYEHKKPMIMRRKEVKDYGIPTSLEGIFAAGDTCLIIEDVITKGDSILETITDVQKAGLVVNDIIVFIDRQQGGVDRLTRLGYRVHVIYTIDDILDILRNEQLIDDTCRAQTREWIAAH